MLDTIPFTSVHSNLEHGLAILTESFSPLRSVLQQPRLLKSKAEVCDKPHYSYFVTCTTTRSNQLKLAPTDSPTNGWVYGLVGGWVSGWVDQWVGSGQITKILKMLT